MNEKANLDTIFCAAIEIESFEQREAYMDEACGEDSELRRQLTRLLEAHFRGGSIIDSPPVDPGETSLRPMSETTGNTIGPYKLLQQLGEGGMGEVYLAEQSEPVERRVAVKIIKAGMDTRQVIARFEAERQALAMMDHPNIAKVFDAGTTQAGRPYFVMELVKGVPITQYCDEHRLDPRQRLELFRDVCHAVQHAHQKGIIHRDIKPSNVLVAEYDDRAVPKIIDFGIAKATQQRLTGKTMFTEVGTVMGTIEYMSPEQAKLNQLDIDTRSDIYSLGVLLYELLTGEPPFDRKKLRSAALDEMLRIIREEEPSRPSIKLSTSESLPSIAANRHVEPKKLSTVLRGELDWIVMKALEKDRTRRYETASAFADDIANYMNDTPVAACPPSASYRLRKFARRNRALFATAGFVFAVLILATIMTGWQAVRATQQRDRAIAAEHKAQQEAAISKAVRDFLQDDLLELADSGAQLAADLTPNPEIRLRTLVDRASEKVGERFEDQPHVETAIRLTLGRVYLGLGEYEKAEGHFRRAWQIAEREEGREHLSSVNSMQYLADAIRFQGWFKVGRYSEAEKLYREMLEIQQRVLGPKHPHTLLAMSSLAHAINEQGRHSEAEKLFRETLEIQQSVLGPEHYNTLFASSGLAKCIHEQGRYREAEEILRDTLEIQQRVLGPEHPETLGSLTLLAVTLMDQGLLAEAEKLFRETLEIVLRVRGPEHIDTLGVMQNVALIMNKQQRHEEAEMLYRETLEIQRRVMGPEHPRTMNCAYGLAVAIRNQGRHSEAENLLRDTLEMQQRSLGPQHPNALCAKEYLADVISKQHRHDEAERLFRETLELRQQALGLEDRDTLRTMNNLANSIASQGRLSEAEELHRETFEIQKRVLGPEHPDTVGSALNLANLFTNQAWRLATAADFAERDPRKAVKLAQEATQIQPDNANHWNNLGVALYRNGQFQDAVEVLQKADAMMGHRDRAHRMFYAMALWKLGKEDLGEAKYAQGAAWIQARRANSEEQERFRAEAEALMGLDPSGREQLIADFFAGRLDSKPTAQEWIDRASGQRQRGSRKESVASLTAAIELDPKSSQAYNDRAWDYMELGEYEKALEDCDKAIALNPKSTRALADRAWANNMLERFTDAITDCDQAIKIDPNHYFAYQRRAWAHREIGDLDRAAADAKRAIEIDPTIPFGKGELTKVAAEFIKSEQWDEASRCFEQLVALQPKNIGNLKQLAWCEYMSRGVDAYRQRCRMAIERFITPEASAPVKRDVVQMCCSVMNAVDDTEAMVQLAREVIAANPPNEGWTQAVFVEALLCNGQSGEAISLLLGDEPDAANNLRGPAMFLLAKAYHASGKTDVAIEWLNKADTWTSQYLAQGDDELAVFPLVVQVGQKDAHEFLGIPASHDSTSVESTEVATSSN